MANSKSTAKTVTVEGTSIQADIAEGKALFDIWKKKESSAKAAFTNDTKAEGFDTRLGNLLLKLQKASSMNGGRISREILATHNLHKIDKRRRSEALWFVKNQSEATAFIETSKKGFTSLTALQAAMRKAAKADKPQTTEGETQTETTEGETSNVGQSQPPKEKVSHKAMVNTIVKQAHFHGLDLEEIIEDLMIVLENREKHNAKAAA
jgi:hypothetical protein